MPLKFIATGQSPPTFGKPLIFGFAFSSVLWAQASASAARRKHCDFLTGLLKPGAGPNTLAEIISERRIWRGRRPIRAFCAPSLYFLAALAEALCNEPLPLGDGALYRAIRLTQRTYWQPPRVTAPIGQDRRKVGEPLLE